VQHQPFTSYPQFTVANGMAVFDAIEAGESAQLQLLGSTFAKAWP
jgi:hypothetical protein